MTQARQRSFDAGEDEWSDVSRTDTRTRTGAPVGAQRRTRPVVMPTGPSAIARNVRPASGPGASGAPRVPFAVLVISMLVGGIALLLMLNTASAANELDRHGLAETDATISAQMQQLQNEVAASAAPTNLSRAAQNLGMVPAGNPAFLVIASDGSATVRGSAVAAAPDPLSIPAAAQPTKKPANKSDKSKTAKAKSTAKSGKTKTTAKTTAKTKPKTSAKSKTTKTSKTQHDKRKHPRGGPR